MREMRGGGKPRLISLLTIYLLPRVTLGCEMIQLFIAAHSLFINRFYKLLFLAREILPIDLMSRHRDHVYPIPSLKLSIKKSRSVTLTIPTRYRIRMFECMRAPN